MSLVRFASICDHTPCKNRSEEWTMFPWCRECHHDTCPDHTEPDTMQDVNGMITVICRECAAAISEGEIKE